MRPLLALRARGEHRAGTHGSVPALRRSPSRAGEPLTCSPRAGSKSSCAAVIVVLDQITKAMVRPALALHESVEVIPGFLDLTRVHNTGAAFGMLNAVDFPMKTVVLSCVALIALGGVAWYAATVPRDRPAGAHRRGRRAGRRHRQPDRSRHRGLRARLRRRLLGRPGTSGPSTSPTPRSRWA